MTSAASKLAPACDDRRALALIVADAVTKVYEAGKKYEAAKSVKAKNAGTLYDFLMEAGAAERNALHVLREHIEEHGYSV